MSRAIGALLAVASLVVAPTAAAGVGDDAPAPVVVGVNEGTQVFPNDTNTCGFPLHETVETRATFRFFQSPDGPFVNITHFNIRFTFTANGRTVLVNQNYTQRLEVEDNVVMITISGSNASIRLVGGGLIVHDAGTFVMGTDGRLTVVHGPHPVLEAGGVPAAVQIICAQLAA